MGTSQPWHCPWLSQFCPLGQIPQLVPHTGSGPQTRVPQLGWQTHCPWASQVCPVLQLPQLVPHTGSGPQTRVPQLGVQQTPLAHTCPDAQQLEPHERWSQTQAPALQVAFAGQLPLWHVPPQPSLAPQALPAQSGWQTHAPPWQTLPVGQGTAASQSVHPLAIFLHVCTASPEHFVAPAVH
jgi:hypothetical protein